MGEIRGSKSEDGRGEGGVEGQHTEDPSIRPSISHRDGGGGWGGGSGNPLWLMWKTEGMGRQQQLVWHEASLHLSENGSQRLRVSGSSSSKGRMSVDTF